MMNDTVKRYTMVAITGFLVACGGGRDQPPDSGFEAGQTASPYPSPTASTAPAPSTPPTATPPGAGGFPAIGAILSDPEGLQRILSGAMAAAHATVGPVVGGDQAVLKAGIDASAAHHAQGMKPEGQLMSAQLSQGGHAEASLMLQPNACYTLVGFGGLGVMKFQVNVLTAPPLPPQVIAQSGGDGVTPVVGSAGNCLRSPVPGAPFPVKVDMHVPEGQGIVGVQAYRK